MASAKKPAAKKSAVTAKKTEKKARPQRKPSRHRRSGLLDTIRGVTVINMVLYHAIWDLVFIFGVNWGWYLGKGAEVWQQCICCTFILLSGFCSGMSRHPVKRGLIVSGIGAAVMLVTAVFMPEDIVVFGVLTLIGSCMLLMALLRPVLEKPSPWVGLLTSLFLFLLTRHIDDRYLGLFGTKLLSVPGIFYQNYLTAYFGFCQPGFYSTDYFPLLPWCFLFAAGFFLHRLAGKKIMHIGWKGIPCLNFIGRHALEIYTVHQPVIYGMLLVWDTVIRGKLS